MVGLSRAGRIAIVGMGLIVAGFFGQIAGSEGVRVLVWPVVAGGALLVLVRPYLGLLAIAVSMPLENMLLLGEGVTFVRGLGMFVAGAWVFHRIVHRQSWRSIFSSRIVWVVIPFVMWAFASSLWAVNVSRTLTGVSQLLRLLLWYLIVVDLVEDWGQIDWIAKSVVVGASIGAAVTLWQYFVEGAARAGMDVAGGINNTAAVLVTILPFAFFLIRSRGNGLWRLAGILYAVLSVIAVTVTLSRMSYLVLTLVVLIQLFDAVAGRKGRLPVIVALTVVVIVAYLIVPWDSVVARAGTIFPYLKLSVGSEEQEMSDGVVPIRGYIFQSGLAMFRDHPLTGVGYHGFKYAYTDYQYIPGMPSYLISPDARRSPHSSYLGLLAELGVIGLVLWIGVLVIAFRNLIKAWSAWDKKTQSVEFLLVQAVTFAFLAQIAYGWAGSNHVEKLMWLFLGLSVVLRRLAEESDRLPESSPPLHLQEALFTMSSRT